MLILTLSVKKTSSDMIANARGFLFHRLISSMATQLSRPPIVKIAEGMNQTIQIT